MDIVTVTIIYQKVVGDSPHAFMRQDNPDDHQVSNHRHSDDAAVGSSPECDLPHGLDELVEFFAVVNGHVSVVGAVQIRGLVERVHLPCLGLFGEPRVKNR